MMNKRCFFLIAILSPFFLFAANKDSVSVAVQAMAHEKLAVTLVPVGSFGARIKHIIPIIQKDLEFSDQFQVIVPSKSCRKLQKTSDIKQFFSHDCSLGIFLTYDKRKKAVSWRLYDLENVVMIKGQEYQLKGRDVFGWAHNISDQIWPALANQPAFFSSKIAYCKEIKRPGKKISYKHLYVADYDGDHETLLVSTPTINMTPRWNNDPLQPLLFYSEHTSKNVRLVFANMKKKITPVSNFDGLNILSTFSHDGKTFAYCASRGDGYCQLYYYKNGQLKRLTDRGNNISPTFSADGKTIYFCSDAHTKCPQVCTYNVDSQKIEQITKGGFHVSTAFSPQSGLLAYAKMVRGVMQIFVYNPKDKSHRQLTSEAGNKEECSWSPCGNYLLFSVEQGNSTRLAMMNLLTGQTRFITSQFCNCYYPSWSPIYAQFPVLS